MFNILSLKGNANENNSEISFPLRMAITKKIITNAGKDEGEKELSYTVV
jgi:hypothetical protein